MAMNLQWNVQERAQQAAQRQAAAGAQAKQEAEWRAILRRDLPLYRDELAAAERALAYWEAEHQRRLVAQDTALLVYRARLHAETGGELPRGPGGQLIEAIDLEGDHPETMAARPAQAQWRAYKKAVAEAMEAGSNARQNATAVRNAGHNLRLAEGA